MPDNKRTDILKKVKEILQTIDALRAVKIGTFLPNTGQDRSDPPKPCAGIIPESCQKAVAAKVISQSNPKPHKTRDLDVLVRVVVDETHQEAGLELDEVLLMISQKMEESDEIKRLDGLLSADIEEGATRWLYLDERWPQAGADIEFKF